MGAPADSIREFLDALQDEHIAAVPRYVRDDIVELRAAFREDKEFAKALRSITARLRKLRSAGATALDHDLGGWWRMKFSSGNSDRSDLRIIFRVTTDAIELRAFGHRHDPESIYRKSARR